MSAHVFVSHQQFVIFLKVKKIHKHWKLRRIKQDQFLLKKSVSFFNARANFKMFRKTTNILRT